MNTLTMNDKIEIMKSAGFGHSAARRALDIGVDFFDTLHELKEFAANELEEPNLIYSVGVVDGHEVYFITYC